MEIRILTQRREDAEAQKSKKRDGEEEFILSSPVFLRLCAFAPLR
jgi:hypothetical protein